MTRGVWQRLRFAGTPAAKAAALADFDASVAG